ncbi:MAG: hypothetical protein B6245_07350 [Desulfobacteraceae bacterium 4572_88]|nr:MAG: hypothetical protein B6245_07350 [Desulfobacteraceae bacterium 4572_88]
MRDVTGQGSHPLVLNLALVRLREQKQIFCLRSVKIIFTLGKTRIRPWTQTADNIINEANYG